VSAARLALTANGMVCAVGFYATAACAAIRAGISGFAELRYADNDGVPIRGARVPPSSRQVAESGPERIVDLLALALIDCMNEAPSHDLEAIPLLVGVAEHDRPGGLSPAQAGGLLAALDRRAGLRFHPRLSRVFTTGHTAAFRALDTAREIVAGRAASACLVAGVDSYLNPETLLWLDSHARLKTPRNSDGVVPGEAAACVLVERPARPPRGVLELAGLGFGHERAAVLTEEPPLQGLGLTAAVREALAEAGLQIHEVDVRSSDVAGEGYAFKELALSLQKLMRVRRDVLPIWHAADIIGDTGAAAGAVQLVIAMQALRRGYAPGRRFVCHASAVPGDRAAAILEGRVP